MSTNSVVVNIKFIHEEKALVVNDEKLYYTDEEWTELERVLRERGICK